MSDSSNSYSSDDDEVELEDNQIDKKQKKAVCYYVVNPEYYIKCKCCENLERTDPEPMPDVDDYLTPRQLREFEDEGARLRIARYRKMMRESGDYEFMLDESTKSVIKEYNEKMGKEMKILKTINVTVSRGGCNKIFFLTLRCSVIEEGTTSNVSIESSEPVEKGTTSNVDTYQAVVSYNSLKKTSRVLFFRRKSDRKYMFKPRCDFFADLEKYQIYKACSGTIPDAVTEGLEK